jgi:hypothetical protein
MGAVLKFAQNDRMLRRLFSGKLIWKSAGRVSIKFGTHDLQLGWLQSLLHDRNNLSTSDSCSQRICTMMQLLKCKVPTGLYSGSALRAGTYRMTKILTLPGLYKPTCRSGVNPAKDGSIWRHNSLTELGVKTVSPFVSKENCEAREDVELGCHATWHVSARDIFNIISPSYGGALHYTYGQTYRLQWTDMSSTELFLLEMFGSVALSSLKKMGIHFRFVITIAVTFVKVRNPRASCCGLSCSVFCFRVMYWNELLLACNIRQATE